MDRRESITYLDAAYEILKKAGQPLHYAEITAQALDEELITPTGLTPDATMGSRLYTETKQEGSRFVRAVGRGLFELAQWQPGDERAGLGMHILHGGKGAVGCCHGRLHRGGKNRAAQDRHVTGGVDDGLDAQLGVDVLCVCHCIRSSRVVGWVVILESEWEQ